MSPDRGISSNAGDDDEQVAMPSTFAATPPDTGQEFAIAMKNEPRNFTFRGVLVGLVIGIIICFSNMYFGLQTGWVSSMAMPSALMGFAYFKTVSRMLSYPFSPSENVLVQSVAGAVGTMPLGCGFVGVIPALNYLLLPSENGPLDISLIKLIVWAVGIAFFGVVFAVPLRKQVIIREKLKFPSGTATALMIGVLHGEKLPSQEDQLVLDHNGKFGHGERREVDSTAIIPEDTPLTPGTPLTPLTPIRQYRTPEPDRDDAMKNDWRSQVRLLIYSFGISAFFTLFSYFVPKVRDVPFLGATIAADWLWTINLSPAYVGQGIIMGPATTLHMLLGAIVGWGILSPLAKYKEWAPGPVDDWTNGSKGWIVWISLAIMLSDSLVSLGWLVLRSVIRYGPTTISQARVFLQDNSVKDIVTLRAKVTPSYSALVEDENDFLRTPKSAVSSESDDDALPSNLISTKVTVIGLILSLGLCIGSVHYSFANLIPLPLTLLALVFALLLSIMGVRALGETDLNPVSGISKLTQLFFAFVVPSGNKNAIIINLLAGALSESGALQAGDLMQDLKAGHLVGAAPNAQFYGQIIGSAVGAVVSAVVYKLYIRVYTIPGDLFQVPTGFVWIYTARLVTGQGLPPMVSEWALGAGLLFIAMTAVRTWANRAGSNSKWVANWVPGGIAVAVGMYNTPSFTIARAAGGLIHWYWNSYRKKPETPIIVLASGLILGEGLSSIVNLLLASMDVPHL